MDKTFKYYLPKQGSREPEEFSTTANSVVVIGANGSGKSHLGAWMEDTYPAQIHRIGAQRSLIFGEYIQQRSYEQALNLLETGQENKQSNGNRDKTSRWGGQELVNNQWKPTYTISMLSDYEYVLAALVAKWHNEQNEYIEECQNNDKQGKVHRAVPKMVVDNLQLIWNQVFPQRQISLKDAKVIASLGESQYKGNHMSDGERVALYLIAQALCLPENKTIVIDEPEIHLHRSIMNRLWEAIENYRLDCLFVYITHDTQFAANHSASDKIWVKEYDGTNWSIEKVEGSDFPEQMLLDILGNRKPVLFVEGTGDSYDTKLYSALYSDYYIVPCGSCISVIERTKAYTTHLS